MMKTKVIGFLTLYFALLVQVSFAQTKIITGKVQDESGVPLIGATVIILNTSRGVSTDFQGRFSIEAANNEKLQISYIGYNTRIITVGNESEYTISMISTTSPLDPVIVTGYGSGRRMSTIVGAISHVQGEKLANKPVANVMDALQGHVPGLQIFTSSGEPSATSSIRLHGQGSLQSGNEPLYVLDGLPIPSSTLITLNANDFENVIVLKDATATAIYGSRAANGVIYITTKKGREGEAEVNLSYGYGFSDLARRGKLGLMDANELLDFQLEKDFIDQEFYDERKASGVNTNWENYRFKDNAPMRKLDISLSGGTPRSKYYVSGNYLNQEGINLASKYERITVRANIDTEVKDWLNFGLKVSGGADTRNTFNYGLNDLRGSLGVYLDEPYWTPYDENGKVLEYIPGLEMFSNEYVLSNQPINDRVQQLNSIVFFEIMPIEGLILKSQYGLDLRNRRYSAKIYPDQKYTLGPGSRTEISSLVLNHAVTNTAEYKFSLDEEKHKITLLVGQEGTKYELNSFDVEVSGMRDERLMEFSAGSLNDINRMPNMSTSQNVFLSFFSKANYDFSNKYFIEASLRSDESSKFGKRNRRATFWSIGGMWNLKKSNFLQNVNWLEELKFRAGYGTVGNSAGIGNYSHLATVGPSTNYETVTGKIITSAGNPKLAWEEQSKLSIGVATSLFENKLHLDIGYYLRKTKNMLMNVPQAFTTGFSSIAENIGGMQNQGIDIAIGAKIFSNNNWDIGFSKTFNYNGNKITSLFNNLDEWQDSSSGLIFIKGKPMYYYYPKWLGVDPEDGMQRWEDPTTGLPTTDFIPNRINQALTDKPRIAPMQGGFSLNASWKKGISIAADFTYIIDNYIFNNDRYFTENPALFGYYNQSKNVLDEWKKPGDKTKFPEFGEEMEADSRLIENADFLRLKNIALSYDVPKSLLANSALKGIRFSVAARNLFTITNYSGLDPEIDSNIAIGDYPNTKQYVASVLLSF